MQLVFILAVVAALISAECGPAEPVSHPAARLLLAGGGIVLSAGFAVAASLLTVRRLRTGEETTVAHWRICHPERSEGSPLNLEEILRCAQDDRRENAEVASSPVLRADLAVRAWALRRFHRLRRVHAALWLLVACGTLYGLQWGQLVRFNWQLNHALLVDTALVLAPVLLPLVLSWAAFYEVDRALRPAPARLNPAETGLPTRWQYLGLQVRHSLGMVLVPVLGLLGVRDATELFLPWAAQDGRETAVLAASLGVLFLLFPCLLRRVWLTRPLEPGPLRTRLELAAARSGLRVRDILVWQTGGMMMNAAVAGLVPRLRYVFLSDALMDRLSEEEIEAVFGHEAGHVRHHHLILRLLTMVAPVSLWLLAKEVWPQTPGWVEFDAIDGCLATGLETGLLLLVAMGLYMLVVFGFYSRLLEHQADLFGCRLLRTDEGISGGLPQFSFDRAPTEGWSGTVPLGTQERPPMAVLSAALEKLAIGNGIARNARGWQHASIARRVDFLSQVLRDPKHGLRFQRRVLWTGSLLLGIVLSPVLYRLLCGCVW